MNIRRFIAWVAIVPLVGAVYLWLRPPTTPTAIGMTISRALENGDVDGVAKYVIPREQAALNLSSAQVRSVLADVIVPAYKDLGVDVSKMRLMPGDYEQYLMSPCGPKAANAQFTLGLIQREDGRHWTTLTNLYLGLQIAEHRIALRTGREVEVKNAQKARDRTLVSLGMTKLYNADDATTSSLKL